MLYKDFAPTPHDPAGAFLPEQGDWIVAPVSRTRDTGSLEESNFECALEMLGGESEAVEVHRFGHWGPGWFEIILVHPSRKSAIDQMTASLEDYPILDEGDHCNREYEAAIESWESWGHSEFISALSNTFDCCDNCQELVEDYWPADETFSLYIELANEPYFEESGGIWFPCIDDVAAGISRTELAKICRGIRRSQNVE